MQLHGKFLFKNNITENGGSISLSNNVPLYFYDKCRVQMGLAVLFTVMGVEKAIDRLTVLPFPASVLVASSPSLITMHTQQGSHALYAEPSNECSYMQINSFLTILLPTHYCEN